MDHDEEIPRPTADSAPPFFLLAGLRGADDRAGAPRAGARRGAVGFFGVVTVRAVRPPEDLPDPPEARDVDELPVPPALELRVLVFPAMTPG
nr:hypothetical protein [Rhodococcus sp. (in: high G+C Gram-positive bacteria)]